MAPTLPPPHLRETAAWVKLLTASERSRTQPRPVHKRHPPRTAPAQDTGVPRIFRGAEGTAKPDIPIALSDETQRRLSRAFHHGWQQSTLVNYGYAVDRFMRFCDAEHIPPNLRLPAHDFVLCAYAASHAGLHAGSTARNDMSALKAWHVAQEKPWQASPRLHYVLCGVENLSPEASRKLPRPPITCDMLSCLRQDLDFSSSFDLAVFAAACMAFWGQCRLGEILYTSKKDPQSEHKPSRADVSNSVRESGSLVVRIPRTKTKKQGDDVVLVPQVGPLNPVVALRMHLIASASLPTSAPLFAYVSDTAFRPLTRHAFLTRCNEVWARSGFPRLTGHSFRIGGTTELLLQGVPPDVVKAMGRWSSDAFLRYWRSLEDLAPLYVKNVGLKRCAAWFFWASLRGSWLGGLFGFIRDPRRRARELGKGQAALSPLINQMSAVLISFPSESAGKQRSAQETAFPFPFPFLVPVKTTGKKLRCNYEKENLRVGGFLDAERP
uniref:DNA breaking-rejoining enzyme n=1 Tax=Mycena chlorophos TaxID=658473 RepID=A0ABQ0LC16_MYCCL|nr:DNA breaking-rejoining enzyme [Mycena chlorophos]